MAANFDAILDNFVGGGGLWQWRIFVFVVLIDAVSVMNLFLHLFTAYTPEHRCQVDICEGQDDLNWVHFAYPTDYKAKEFLIDGQSHDPCHMYPVIDHEGTCSSTNFNTSATPQACDQYVFNQSVFEETITTKFLLVCDREEMARFLGTIMMLGLLIGSLIGGRLSDELGRKKTLFIAILLSVPSVALGGFATEYWMYAVLRLIACTCIPIIWYSNHSLVLEIFSARYRTVVGCFKNCSWPISMVFLPLMSYTFRLWSHAHLVLATLCCITLIPLHFISESPRWVLENRTEEEGVDLIKDIAKVNNKILLESDLCKIRRDLKAIQESIVKYAEANNTANRKLSIRDMFHRENFAISLLVIFMWICTIVGTFTLTLNATKLNESIFFNFAICSLSEWACAILTYLVTQWKGRVKSLALFFILTSTSCFILAFIPKDMTLIIFVVYMTGRCFASGSFNLTALVTSELYPTNLRSQATGLCSTVSRIFGLCCPFVASLAVLWEPLPMVALGAPITLAGVLVSFMLPDSSGTLPQHMSDALKKPEKRNNEIKV